MLTLKSRTDYAESKMKHETIYVKGVNVMGEPITTTVKSRTQTAESLHARRAARQQADKCMAILDKEESRK